MDLGDGLELMGLAMTVPAFLWLMWGLATGNSNLLIAAACATMMGLLLYYLADKKKGH